MKKYNPTKIAIKNNFETLKELAKKKKKNPSSLLACSQENALNKILILGNFSFLFKLELGSK